MPYDYLIERPWLFTESGQVALLKTRDNAFRFCDEAGAFLGVRALKGVDYGDTFKAMAILDRLVELRDIREITSTDVWGQDRVFIRVNRDAR
jgi:hypothetical protein